MYKTGGLATVIILLNSCGLFKKKLTADDQFSVSSSLEEVNLLNATKHDSLSKNLKERSFYWLRDSSITFAEGDNITITNEGVLSMTKGKVIRKELKNIRAIEELNSKIKLNATDNRNVKVTKTQESDLEKISTTVQSEVKTKNKIWAVIMAILLFVLIFFSLKRFVKL